MQSNTAQTPPSGSLRTHLIKGAAGSFVLQVGFAGLSFLNAIILARVLGAEGYGAFANAMAWVSLLTIPATFGFGILLVRDVAIYRSQAKWGLLKGLLRFSDRFVLVFSVTLALVAATAAGWMFTAPAQELMRHTVWVALLLLPLFALYNLREAAIRGLEYVIRARLPGMIIRPVLLLSGMVAIYFIWPDYLSAPVAMAVNVGAGAVALALGVFFLHKLLPTEAKITRPEYTPHLWLKSAFPMLIYGGAQIVLGQTDIVMLGAMRGAHEVGLYAAANRMAYLLVFVMSAFGIILAPIVARMNADGENEHLQKIITKITRGSFFVALPIGLVMIFAGQNILVIFGHEFVAGQTALIILVIGRLVDIAVGGNSSLVLSMTGHERIVSNIFSVSALVNILLNALLIPQYGIQGAAIATVASLISMKIVLSSYSATRAGYHMTVFGIMTNSKVEDPTSGNLR